MTEKQLLALAEEAKTRYYWICDKNSREIQKAKDAWDAAEMRLDEERIRNAGKY